MSWNGTYTNTGNGNLFIGFSFAPAQDPPCADCGKPTQYQLRDTKESICKRCVALRYPQLWLTGAFDAVDPSLRSRLYACSLRYSTPTPAATSVS